MQQLRFYIFSALIGLFISSTLIAGYHFVLNKNSNKKIGYIRTGELLTKYDKMLVANKKFEGELKVVQANIDTLKYRYFSIKNNKNLQNRSPKDWGYQVGAAESDFMKYQQDATKQMEMRKTQLTSEVLNQVNAYIEDYGKKNSYAIILGATGDGNILYGQTADDLTDVMLGLLNGKTASDSLSVK